MRYGSILGSLVLAAVLFVGGCATTEPAPTPIHAVTGPEACGDLGSQYDTQQHQFQCDNFAKKEMPSGARRGKGSG